MHLPSWPSETQCRSAPSLARRVLEVGERLFLDRDDRDVVAEIAGALEGEKGKLAVAGDDADA